MVHLIFFFIIIVGNIMLRNNISVVFGISSFLQNKNSIFFLFFFLQIILYITSIIFSFFQFMLWGHILLFVRICHEDIMVYKSRVICWLFMVLLGLYNYICFVLRFKKYTIFSIFLFSHLSSKINMVLE